MRASIAFIFLNLLMLQYCFAQHYLNDQYGFSIDIPKNNSWDSPQIMTQSEGKLKKPLELLVVVANTKTQNKISIQVIDVDDDITMSGVQHREGFKVGLLKSGGFQVAFDSLITLATAPCYQLILIGSIKGNPINMCMMAFNANGFQYNLTSYSSDTTKLIDKSLEKILKSFKFNKPPKIPKSK